ncbi:MAG: hypothetical protein H6812_12105 [Phycisphaeraceae bacterium]|nr:hypothetical protein [Phycisphaerales bacterium]MCB9843980.1 hypothetical protein [Phycisphaeraceae bacterium]
MCRALLVASMCLLLASCGASPVRIRVTQLDGQQAGQPVRGARVRAVMLDAGTIPLPLNFDTLAEMLTKQETIAVTDRGGVARLALLRDRSQLIEVEGPLDFTGRPIPTARWLLTAESVLEPVSDNAVYRAELVP